MQANVPSYSPDWPEELKVLCGEQRRLIGTTFLSPAQVVDLFESCHTRISSINLRNVNDRHCALFRCGIDVFLLVRTEQSHDVPYPIEIVFEKVVLGAIL